MASWLYVVDHFFRDLPAYSWWALTSFFHETDEVYLVSMSEVSSDLLLEANIDIVVWNYARPTNIDLISQSKKLGIYNIIHDTEGIPYDLRWYFSNLSPQQFLNIDEIWAWGEVQKLHIESLLVDICSSSPLVRNTGSIRYEYIKSLPKINLATSSMAALWNTNFPLLSPKYQTIDCEFNELITSHKYLSMRESLEYFISISDLRSYASTSIERILDNNQLDMTLYIRPHPFESLDYYEPISSLYPQFNISKNGDLHQDFELVSLLIHSGCQTCLDGFMRGLPSFNFRKSLSNLWTLCSNDITNEIIEKKAFLDRDFLAEQLELQHLLFEQHGVAGYLSNLSSPISLDCTSSKKSLSALPTLYCYYHRNYRRLKKGVKRIISNYRPNNVAPGKQSKLTARDIQQYFLDSYHLFMPIYSRFLVHIRKDN